MIGKFWNGLERSARLGLIAGMVCILGSAAAIAYWVLRTDYQILFSDLNQQDAAAISAELEKMKIPFSVSTQSEGGESILIDKNDVYKTRIKLMGKDIPLHGGVGLELFSNSDFGMSEFAQKINYQRAMQGELTRTILSLSEIRDARVMLALPERGLFKQDAIKGKASITLALRPGRSLRPDQVTGIQRLVASSVSGIAAQDVTIVDQTGTPLTRAVGDGDAATAVAPDTVPLELKKETENYLARKAADVLAQALGEGQALASVDVVLNLDRVQTTLEDVLPASGRVGVPAAGVIVRQRESLRDGAAPLNVRPNSEQGGATASGQRETEYTVGRRVEHVISQPGSIQRIQVVAVIRKNLDREQQEQIRRMVAASVGASEERGDSVVVQSMGEIGAPASSAASVEETMQARSEDHSTSGRTAPEPGPAPGMTADGVLAAIFACLLIVAIPGTALCLRRMWHRRSGTRHAEVASLSHEQRKLALSRIQTWMQCQGVRDASGDGR